MAKMKAETKKARIAALLGIELPKPPTKEELEDATQVSREMEAVIAFGNRSQKMVQRECVNCGGIFAVNRSSISCCSDTCRQHYLLHNFGLEVDLKARTPEDRWSMSTGGPEPLIVPPAVLPLVLESQTRIPDQTHTPVELDLEELLDLTGIADL